MKKGELALVLGVLVYSIFFISSISALTASISNPRMVLYENFTEPNLEFENSVIVNNDNAGEVLIKIIPTGDWENRVTVSDNNFDLRPGERREVFYTVSIEEPGHYSGDILVTFSEKDDPNELSVAQDLVVLVLDETGKVPEKSSNVFPNWVWWLIGGVVFLILLVLIVNLMRGTKKK